METRKIAVKEGPDIIRWGKCIKRMFTILEGYHIKAGRTRNPDIKKWDRIWQLKTWPKVVLFTWILLHRRALTWDQLRRKGTHGPSCCALCQNGEETMEHIANSCSVSNNLWKNHHQLFDINNRNTGSIRTTIEKWSSKSYCNTILNRASNLSIGFLLWNLWKARNRVIFKEDEKAKEEI